MIICAAGDIHGAVDRLYADVLDFEVGLGAGFEWVLHVGDLGIWPDANRIDRATRMCKRSTAPLSSGMAPCSRKRCSATLWLVR